MRYIFALLLIINSFISFGQGTETFANLTASRTTFEDGTYTGDNGLSWSYSGARTPDAEYEINRKSIGFASSRVATRQILTTTDANGIGTLTFKLRSYFTSGTAADRQVEVFIGRSSVGTFTLNAMNVIEDFSIDVNSEGATALKIQSIGSQEIVLDDVSWTAYTPPVATNVVINEVYPYPPRGGYEFVELYNISDRNVDISGWTISNGNSIVYTIPEGTVMASSTFFVVRSTDANTNTLLLDNVTGEVVLNNGSSGLLQVATVDQVSYSDLSEGQSVGRESDGTGSFVVLGQSTEGETNATTLPVEFKSFEVFNKNDFRQLTWTTLSEINNDRFEIEVSNNGVEYRTIGSVSGNGTSSEENIYTYNDYSSIQDAQVYYRIKQIDFNGEYDYSEVVSIELNSDEVAVFPNPVQTILTIKGAGNFVVYDLLGKTVEVVKNTNQVYRLNTSGYEAGIYLIQLENGKIVRFVKR